MKAKKHLHPNLLAGLMLFLTLILSPLLLSACAASPGESASVPRETTAPPRETTAPPRESTAATAALSTEAETESETEAEYPFDFLGVMSLKTRLGPSAPPGEIIDYDTYMSPAGADEIKMVYLSVDGKTMERRDATAYYRFQFDGGESDNLPCRISVFLNGHAAMTDELGGRVKDFAQAGYLYHHCLLQKYRPVTDKDMEDLNFYPIAWICFEGEQGQEVFAMSDTGYLLHAADSQEETPSWEAVFDMITEEPLPEEVRLHAAALALRYMECEGEALLPQDNTETGKLPEEYWAADLSLAGKEKTLFGQEVLAIKGLYNGGILGNGGDWGIWSLGPGEDAPGVIRLQVRNGLKEREEDKYGLRNELLIFPDGSLVLERERMGVSAFGFGDGFSIWAPIQIRLARKISAELYQQIKELIETDDPVSGAEKAVPLISAKMTEADKNAVPEMSLPRGGEGIDYTEDTVFADFLPDGKEGFFLLDAGEKQLIHLAQEAEGLELRPLSLSFCRAPRRLAGQKEQLFILDEAAVWLSGAALDQPEDWESISLPAGVQGDDILDMLIELGSQGQELVLVGREGDNYGLLLSSAGNDRSFQPTSLGYRLEKTEYHTKIHQGGVSWEASLYPDEMQVIEISSRYLSFCLINPDQTEASLRTYGDYRDAPMEAVSGEKSRVVMSDWITVPKRLCREGFLLAPRVSSLDIYRLRPGEANILP